MQNACKKAFASVRKLYLVLVFRIKGFLYKKHKIPGVSSAYTDAVSFKCF